ncbi:hypothetical protein MMC07_006480 [Pseudocyphellaria aurata]|nr:hypothetical protein [Pseudocyphellaria aurata]
MSSAMSFHYYAFSPTLSPSPSLYTAGAGANATLRITHPGAPTPTFPKGPRNRRRLQSLITGRFFDIAPAPTGPKLKRGDNGAQTARRSLRWNIADSHAWQYGIVKQWAWDRAGVLRQITPEIINLITPTTATITPSTASVTILEVINLITPSTAATILEIKDLITPRTAATDDIEVIDLVTPTPSPGTTAGSGASFLTPSTYDRP